MDNIGLHFLHLVQHQQAKHVVISKPFIQGRITSIEPQEPLDKNLTWRCFSQLSPYKASRVGAAFTRNCGSSLKRSITLMFTTDQVTEQIRETHTNTHGAWNDLSKCTYQLPTIVSIHVWTFKGMNMSELCCRHTGARTTHNTNLILVTRRSWVSVNPAAAPPSTVSASSPTHVALLNILTAYKVHAFHNRSASSTWSLTKTNLTIRWYWNLVMKIK